MSLLAIIRIVMVSETESHASVLYANNAVWLLDCLQPLGSLLAGWPTPLEGALARFVQMALDFAEAQSNSPGTESALYHKASSALTFVCAEFCQGPEKLLAEDEDGFCLRRILCFALVYLAKAAADHEPTARLICSGLLASAQRLVSENPIAGAGTDVWVGFPAPLTGSHR